VTATPAGKCGWNTGTARTGPGRCGKTSKATTDHPTTDNGEVCGIHSRKVVSGRYAPVTANYTVTPLAAKEA
jgi:hypothetical protein